MTDLLTNLLTWVETHPTWAGIVLFALSFAESFAILGMLVPGVVIILGIGALIGAGALDFWPMLIWAFAGAVLGDGFSYWLGWRFREPIYHVWPLNKYPQAIATGHRFFERYGDLAVVFARFFGPGRATVPLIAGSMEMPMSRFLAANVGSAALWAPAYLGVGMLLGEYADRIGWRLGAAIGVLLLIALTLGATLRLLILAAIPSAWRVKPIFSLLAKRPWHGAMLLGTTLLGMAWLSVWLAVPHWQTAVFEWLEQTLV